MSKTHRITLITQDGEEETFDCAEDVSIIDRAEAANIRLPVICRKGTCGSCRARCSKGDYDLRFFAEGILSEKARKNNEILLCQTFAKGQMTIELPFDYDRLGLGPPPEFMCEIISNEAIGGRVRKLRLKALPDNEGRINSAFESGQYMNLEIPGTKICRSYSIANTTNWLGDLEFFIHLKPDGLFSNWLLNNANPGTTLHSYGPMGYFTVRDSVMPRRFVAGGTGIAPILSMLRKMAELQEQHETRLYFGLTKESNLFAMAEIEELKAKLPNLSVFVCIWQPGADWKGYTGLPVDLFQADLADDLAKGIKPQVYISGPTEMITATVEITENLFLPHENVFFEWQS